MTTNLSLWHFIANAGFVVKLVLIILTVASILSWALIFQRGLLLNRIRKSTVAFLDQFWSGPDLNAFYNATKESLVEKNSIENIFIVGFQEFLRLRKHMGMKADDIMQGLERAMLVQQTKELDKLDSHMSFLATVGSISPYVGLFGTVWGIMVSFQALGTVQQATISMVAPGISEALIATALGLFAAIPAVVAYNRYQHQIERIAVQYEMFQHEFSAILHRQVHLP